MQAQLPEVNSPDLLGGGGLSYTFFLDGNNLSIESDSVTPPVSFEASASAASTSSTEVLHGALLSDLASGWVKAKRATGVMVWGDGDLM